MPRLATPPPQPYIQYAQSPLPSSSPPSPSFMFNNYSSRLGATSESLNALIGKTSAWFFAQPMWRRCLIVLILCFGGTVGLLVLIFHKKILEVMINSSAHWAKMRGGRLIMFALVFTVGFPPLIGFSALSTLTGMIYGFPYGWPLLASASVTGSLCSFVVFRYFLIERAQGFVKTNRNFAALSAIMREDKRLTLLILVRLCPLPYSLSNGALAAIPDISVMRYFLASLITSPKLLIHIFVGSKLKDIGETDESSTQLIDILSILITGLAATATTYIIYVKMQAKLQEFESTHPSDGAGSFDLYDQLEAGNERFFNPELQTLNSAGGSNPSQFDLDSTAFDDDPSSIDNNFLISDDESYEREERSVVKSDDEEIRHNDLGA